MNQHDEETLEVRMKSLAVDAVKGGVSFYEFTRKAKRKFVESALAICKGNQTQAARVAGYHRNTIIRHIAELSIAVPRRKPRSVSAPTQEQRRA